MADVAATYLDTYERFSALGGALSSAELAMPVLACPGWSVKDTIGHVTGIAADLVGGRGRVSEPDGTARQVEERRDRPIAAVLAEWEEAAAAVIESMRASRSGLTSVAIDAWTHEQDVRNAVRRPGGRDASGMDMTLKAAISADQRIRAAGLAPMHLITGAKTWYLGDGARAGAEVVLDIDPYEAARMLLGRRTYEEMAAYPWVGDATPYLPHLHQFTVPERALAE